MRHPLLYTCEAIIRYEENVNKEMSKDSQEEVKIECPKYNGGMRRI